MGLACCARAEAPFVLVMLPKITDPTESGSDSFVGFCRPCFARVSMMGKEVREPIHLIDVKGVTLFFQRELY